MACIRKLALYYFYLYNLLLYIGLTKTVLMCNQQMCPNWQSRKQLFYTLPTFHCKVVLSMFLQANRKKLLFTFLYMKEIKGKNTLL